MDRHTPREVLLGPRLTMGCCHRGRASLFGKRGSLSRKCPAFQKCYQLLYKRETSTDSENSHHRCVEQIEKKSKGRLKESRILTFFYRSSVNVKLCCSCIPLSLVYFRTCLSILKYKEKESRRTEWNSPLYTATFSRKYTC